MDSEHGLQEILNREYLSQTERQRENLVCALERIDEEIHEEMERSRATLDGLHKKREGLQSQISAMDTLLGKEYDGGISEHSVGVAFEPQVQRQESDLADAPLAGPRADAIAMPLSVPESVNIVHEILREKGPLHYRAIHGEVKRRGFEVPGQDPAATLLARFSRDPRIKRVFRGTYVAQQ